MTLSVDNQDPVPAAVDVSPTTAVRFRVVTDDAGAPVDKDTINVWINGTQVVANGVLQTLGSSININGAGSFQLIVFPARRLPQESSVTVRVTADDEPATSSLDTSWSFTVGDTLGPVLAESIPGVNDITTISPTLMSMRVTDPGSGFDPALHVEDFLVNAANLDVGGNQVSFTPASPSESFTGREGAVFIVNSGASIGERRRIVSVQGPGLATFDGGALSGASEQISVLHRRGLDVYVDGTRVVDHGVPDADAVTAGWAPVVTTLANNDIQVDLTVPVAWTAGTRVPVTIRAADTNPGFANISDINYVFDVIDVRGPQVVDPVPADGARGLDAAASPNSDLTFDIVCTEGVDTATISVEVNGVAAITAGAGVGDWSGSTITAIDGGQRVVLKRSTPYTDGEIVFLDINASDSAARPGERRILRYHFGTAVDDAVVNHGLAGNDVVRVIAFDLSDTSFAKPKELAHTGYAADGFWYQAGNADEDLVASWFTELGAFPVSGHIVATATNGWAIVRALDSAAWASCAPATSPAWSMADNDAGALTDAVFGPDAVLTLAGETVLAVDFTRDRAERYDTTGLVLSSGDISSRASDQSGNLPDTDFVLPAGPYPALAAIRQQLAGEQHLVMAVASASALSLVQVLGPSLSTSLQARDAVTTTPDTVVTRAFPGTWVRARMPAVIDEDSLMAMVVAYNDSGQGQIEIWDWYKFVNAGANELFLDDASTPALAAAEARDLDAVHVSDLYVAAAMVGEVNVLDFADLTVAAYTETDLGLNGVAGAEMSAVALEPGFTADLGHLYAAVAAVADGRVSRFRVHSPTAGDRAVVMHNGQPFSSLSATGTTVHDRERYVRTRMSIA